MPALEVGSHPLPQNIVLCAFFILFPLWGVRTPSFAPVSVSSRFAKKSFYIIYKYISIYNSTYTLSYMKMHTHTQFCLSKQTCRETDSAFEQINWSFFFKTMRWGGEMLISKHRTVTSDKLTLKSKKAIQCVFVNWMSVLYPSHRKIEALP